MPRLLCSILQFLTLMYPTGIRTGMPCHPCSGHICDDSHILQPPPGPLPPPVRVHPDGFNLPFSPIPVLNVIYSRELCRHSHGYVNPGSYDHPLLIPHVPQLPTGSHNFRVCFLSRGCTSDIFADDEFHIEFWFGIN